MPFTPPLTHWHGDRPAPVTETETPPAVGVPSAPQRAHSRRESGGAAWHRPALMDRVERLATLAVAFVAMLLGWWWR